MNVEKKKYTAPKYEMVKFDSQIMTVWSPGCSGVMGLRVEDLDLPGTQCERDYTPNVLSLLPNYWT